MAERPGFEPGVRFDPYNALAGRHLQPLGHLSAKAGDTLACIRMGMQPGERHLPGIAGLTAKTHAGAPEVRRKGHLSHKRAPSRNGLFCFCVLRAASCKKRGTRTEKKEPHTRRADNA